MTSVIFFGSSEFSVIILEKLLELPEFEVRAIVSKIDKPVGRDQKITPNPTVKFALDHNLKLIQLEGFSQNWKLEIGNLQAQLGLCVAFGPPYFDQEMIDVFPFKIVNIHPSPLPKYRGATPGPWQIINGETKSTITFFQIDEKSDHGPIITQVPFDISPTETSQTFYDKAFSLAADNLDTTLKSYISNLSSVTPQDHSQKTYFPKLDKDSARIDWSWEPTKIERFVRALLPWPIAWTFVENQKGERLKMKVFSFNTEPVKVQIEGKTPIAWKEIEKYYKLVK